MISLETLEDEIRTLEEQEPTFTTMQKLASLYIVRDHLATGNSGRSSNSAVISARDIITIMPQCSGDFGKCCSGVEIEKLIDILNEHMSVVRSLLPKEYNAVLQRLRG